MQKVKKAKSQKKLKPALKAKGAKVASKKLEKIPFGGLKKIELTKLGIYASSSQ